MKKNFLLISLLILAGLAFVTCTDRGLDGPEEQKPQGSYYVTEDCLCEWITPIGRFGNNYTEALDSLTARYSLSLSIDCPNGYTVEQRPFDVWEWTEDSRDFFWPSFIDDRGSCPFSQTTILDEYGYAYSLHTCPD